MLRPGIPCCRFVSEGEAMEKIAIVTGHEGSGTEKAPLSNGVSDARELLKVSRRV